MAVGATPLGGVPRRRPLGLPLARRGGGARRGLLVAGLVLLALIVAAALLGPLLTPYASDERSADVLVPPGPGHPFGTDQFGRDVLSQTLHAARVDLLIGVVLVGVALVVGTIVGTVAAYAGGWADTIVARVVDVALAFPFLVLVIAIVGLRGPGLTSLFIAVSCVAWVFYARLVRQEVLAVRSAGWMRAARASGFGHGRVLARHLLPNVVVQPVLYATSDFVYALLLGTSVSYVGLGVQPPTPEWGQMIASGGSFLLGQPWLVAFPAGAIVLTALAFSLIGDGLADRIGDGRA